MRIGILDIDTKKEKNNREAVEKYPNPACGKIYGYHKLQGDEVIYPWNGEKVDKLYISTIFSWSKKYIMKNMNYFNQRAKEVVVGGSGWDEYSLRPLRDWVNGHAFRNVKNFFEFDRYQKAMEKNKQLTLF